MNDIAQTEIEVTHALAGEPAGIANALASRRAADAVEVLNNLDRAVAVQVLEAMPLEAAVLVFNESHLDQAAELIEQMPAERAAAILIGIHPDRRADIFRALPVGLREALKPRLDKPMRETLDQLLAYPPQTAGGLMTTEFVSVPADWTVEQTLGHIRGIGRTKEIVYTVCLLDPRTKRLVRVIALGRLVTIPRPTSSPLRGPTSRSRSRR